MNGLAVCEVLIMEPCHAMRLVVVGIQISVFGAVMPEALLELAKTLAAQIPKSLSYLHG